MTRIARSIHDMISARASRTAVAGTCLAVAIFSACAIPTLDMANSAAAAGTIAVTIANGGAVSAPSTALRTVVPGVPSNAKCYDIVLKNAGTTLASTTVTSTSAYTFPDIAPGEITIAVTAYGSDTVKDSTTIVGTGSATVTLAAGGTAAANVQLSLAQTTGATPGHGNISLTIQWPTASADSISWYLDGDTANTNVLTSSSTPPIVSDGVTATSSVTLSASNLTSGTHTVRINFLAGGTSTGTQLEVVNVYDNMTSDRFVNEDGTLSAMRAYTASEVMKGTDSKDVRAVVSVYSGSISKLISLVAAATPVSVTTTAVAVSVTTIETDTITVIPSAILAGESFIYSWNGGTETSAASDTPLTFTWSPITDPAATVADRTKTLTLRVISPNNELKSLYAISIRAPLHLSTGTDLATALATLNGTLLDNNVVLDGPVTLNGSIAAGYATGTLGAFSGTLNGNGNTITITGAGTATGNKGLIGTNTGTIENLHIYYPDGFTGITSGTCSGGIAGYNAGTIYRCSVSGTIKGTVDYLGGIIGSNHGNIRECYSMSNISGRSFVGGIAGDNSAGTIVDCYSRGSITGTGVRIGGITGYENITGTTSNCYSTGKIAGLSDTGGVIGLMSGAVTSCYYDSETSSQSDTGKGEGKTTAEMQTMATYTGWDFTSVWAIDPEKNGGYPYLRSRPLQTIAIPAGSMTGATFSSYITRLDADYTLAGDITLTTALTPIGNATTPFTGIFDGNGHTIANLAVSNSGGDAGFFGVLGAGALVTGVRLKNVNVLSGGTTIADDGVGGLVGENYGGTVTRCSVTGSVSGFGRTGGLIGNNRSGSVVLECYSNATVTTTHYSDGTWAHAGGFVGSNWGTISNCFARGNVSSAGPGGGFAGSNEASAGIITNCYAACTVSGGTRCGFTSANTGSASGCHYDSSVSGLSDTTGAMPETTGTMTGASAISTFGWSSSLWTIDSAKNGGYPYLQALEPDAEIVIPGGPMTAAAFKSYFSDPTASVVLEGNVTLTTDWTPISTFKGTFDGGRHTITGLTIAATSGSQALFAELAGSATVKNLGLASVSISSSSGQYISAIAAVNYGHLYRCWAKGTITGEYRIGGLVGENKLGAMIEECYSAVNVVTTTTTYDIQRWNIGSLVAGNYGTVRNCYARGSVTGKELRGVGGFMGYNESGGTAINCYATGLVTVTGSYDGPGGFTGTNASTITSCFYDGETTHMIDIDKGTGAATATMKTQSTYTGWNIGNDSTYIWGMGSVDGNLVNGGYPFLWYFNSETVVP